MTESDKIVTENSLSSLGNGYFGICAFGGLIWIVLAMYDSPAPVLALG